MNVVLALSLGLLVGTFISRLSYRIPRGVPLFARGSFCPHCHFPLSLPFKIPLLSFLLLKGRCFYCHFPIPLRYPAQESISALLALAGYLRFGWSPEFVFYFVLASFVLLVSVIDLESLRIPHSLLLAMAAAGFGLNFIFPLRTWTSAGLGMLAGAGILFALLLFSRLLSGQALLGMGDVQFAAVAGFYLGYPQILPALVIAFFLVLVGIPGARLFHIWTERKEVPFAPFLATGLLLFVLWGISQHHFSLVLSLLARGN